jgi:hypothetical protein
MSTVQDPVHVRHPGLQCTQALDDSGDDWDGTARRGGVRPATKKRRAVAAASEDEEGEVEDDLDAFDDGYGSDLMGDDDDRYTLVGQR